MNNMIERMGVYQMGQYLRDKRGDMTQEQLEELSGVSQGMISRLERGEIKRPNLEFVRAIARALDAPYEAFITALHEVGTALISDDYLDAIEEREEKWRLLELPPDVTTGELLMLKHLFRGLRSGEVELAERSETVGDALPASQPQRKRRASAS
jgi:transcriptional regulator with XRE-family HTH domain